MSVQNPTNVAASVHARLYNVAKEAGRSLNEIIQLYGMERFLYRLSQSPYARSFVLKGALTLRIWGIEGARPTMDIDLLGRIKNTRGAVAMVIKDCMAIECADGITFDDTTIETVEITQDAEYMGVRATFLGYLGRVRIRFQVDTGFGDAVVPEPSECDYPQILNFGAPHLLVYSPETSVAEKFNAMVELEAANSRMKDFYDIFTLANQLTFEGQSLAETIAATFGQRNTPVPTKPPLALTHGFAEDETKQAQWRAFAKRLGVLDELKLEDTIAVARDLLMPVCSALNREDKEFRSVWPKGGPWQDEQ